MHLFWFQNWDFFFQLAIIQKFTISGQFSKTGTKFHNKKYFHWKYDMLLVEEMHFRSLSFFFFLFGRVHDLPCDEGTLEFNSFNCV